MDGRLAALYRHPVKGFTPEPLTGAVLEAGAHFPGDRLYAVENGPSGYDPAAPVHLPKKKFTVLAQIPSLARVRTAYDDASGEISVALDEVSPRRFSLATVEGRAAFARWLEAFVAPEDRRGPFQVLRASGPCRFTDDQAGHVSLINLASLRDLAERLGRPVDPRRFRGNLLVDGWEPWSELDLAPGAQVRIGAVSARVVKPIVRCMATHVDPDAGERDIDLVRSLFQHYGRMTCGLYLEIAWGGRIGVGDPIGAGEPAVPAAVLQDRPVVRFG